MLSVTGLLLLNFAFAWLILSFLVANAASNLGRFARRYFKMSMLLSPLVAWFHLKAEGQDPRTMVCPYCESRMKKTDEACPNCGMQNAERWATVARRTSKNDHSDAA